MRQEAGHFPRTDQKLRHAMSDDEKTMRQVGNPERPYDRIFLIVLDSLGIGGASDAGKFGDEGSDTFGHIAERHHLRIPNLSALGVIDLHPVAGYDTLSDTLGRYCRLSEVSASKDTMSGHWEMMGVETEIPFITFPDGFSEELISELEKKSGRKVIGNKVASGTAILDELGDESREEGSLIVYTSADSVLQIAADEEIMGLSELYRCCEIARELTLDERWKVGRVIARPFVRNSDGSFTRTANRRDYTIAPSSDTDLDALAKSGIEVRGIGKIGDIFSMRGISSSVHSDSSVQGMEQTIEAADDTSWSGLCFVNLVDFDSQWGHRRNPEGYAEEIERFDVLLGRLMDSLEPKDLLILTADHGNDPTWRGTDHTRENVPFIAWSPAWKEKSSSMLRVGGKIDDRASFGVIGATIAENFGVKRDGGACGESMLDDLL